MQRILVTVFRVFNVFASTIKILADFFKPVSLVPSSGVITFTLKLMLVVLGDHLFPDYEKEREV